MTLAVTVLTTVAGAWLLGEAIAVPTGPPTAPRLSVWTDMSVTDLDLDVTVGRLGNWDDDPAFVTGPVTASISARAAPNTVARVMIMGAGDLATSPWESDREVRELDPRTYAEMSRGASSCVRGTITAHGGFADYPRALVLDVPVDASGSGTATLTYTHDRRWWRASADTSDVALPDIELPHPSQCVIAPEGVGASWVAPASWSLTEAAAQPNLKPGDEVLVPSLPDERNELYASSRRAARWTESSEAPSTYLASYRLNTANTRARASTLTFVAALLWGLALAGLFELLRASSPTTSGDESGSVP